jgi:chromosome partitioning protein
LKTVAFFNNKGGVGKTSLVYHLSWMFAEMGHRVIAADLDPQANLTSICLSDDRLIEIWQSEPRPTIFSAIAPLKKGVGEVLLRPLESVASENVASKFALIVGDLELSAFEDDLSANWSKCLDRDERAFRVTTAFSRIVAQAGENFGAEIGLIDVGPNLGAINRAALISADFVVIPAAPDLFSVQGLENVGPRLISWRGEWQERRAKAPIGLDFELPTGGMRPIGYVVSRHSIREGRQVRAFRNWLDKLPDIYREKVDSQSSNSSGLGIDDDKNCLAQLKDYRSLMPMAQEARKPMFLLKPADGAIGGHQGAVRQCFADFQSLANAIGSRIGLPKAR